MSLLIGRRRRDCSWTITIYQTDGTLYRYTAADNIRVKVGREGAVPTLDFSSSAASANGSTVTAANPCTVVVRAADFDLLSRGVYELEIAVVDDSNADQINHVQSHVLTVLDTQAGAVSV